MWRWLPILLLCLPCFATTYYVDPVSGSDGNAGTSFGAAWATTQKALDSASTAGDEVRLCKTGTESTSVKIDADTNAGVAYSYIKFISYNSTGTTKEDGYTIQASSSMSTLINFEVSCDYTRWEGINFDGNSNAAYVVSNTVADGSDYHVLVSCSMHDGTGDGLSVRGSAFWLIYKCDIYNNGGYGISHASANRGPYQIVGSKIHDNSSGGWQINKDCSINCSEIYDNGGPGVEWGSNMGSTVFANLTVYGNSGDGIQLYPGTSRNLYRIYNCTFSSNGGYGIKSGAGTIEVCAFFGNNHFYNNTSGDSDVTLIGTNQSGDPKFTSTTNGSEDFTPLTGSPLINNGIGGTDIGAVAHADASGGAVIIIED